MCRQHATARVQLSTHLFLRQPAAILFDDFAVHWLPIKFHLAVDNSEESACWPPSNAIITAQHNSKNLLAVTKACGACSLCILILQYPLSNSSPALTTSIVAPAAFASALAISASSGPVVRPPPFAAAISLLLHVVAAFQGEVGGAHHQRHSK